MRQLALDLVLACLLLSCSGTWAAETTTPRFSEVMAFPGERPKVNAWTVFGLAFSPDGRYLASGWPEGVVRIWDTQDQYKVLPPFHSGRTADKTLTEACGSRIAFSQDGRKLLTGSTGVWQMSKGSESAIIDHDAHLWDVQTGAEVRTFAGHKGFVMCVAFLPGGKQIATGSVDGTVRIWDVETGKERQSLSVGYVWSVAVSPDGRLLLIGASGGVSVWDTGRWKRLFEYTTENDIRDVAFSPDQEYFIGADTCGSVIHVWRTKGYDVAGKIEDIRPSLWSVAFEKNSRYIVVCSATHNARVGDQASTATSDVRLVECPNGNVVTASEPMRSDEYMTAMAVSPSGMAIACGNRRYIRLWELRK